MSDLTLKAAIEAIFYVSDEPVTLDLLAEAFPQTPREEILGTVEELGADFDAPGRGVVLRNVAGGWRLSTRVECHESVRGFLKSRPGFKLSMAALETLAIVAYKQPVTIPEIMAIRGVKSAGAVKTLLEKKLISPRGRRKVVGSPMQYGTSKEFLLHFGLSSLKDLPTLEEFEEIFGDKADQLKQKNLFDTKQAGIAAARRGKDSEHAAPDETEEDLAVLEIALPTDNAPFLPGLE